MLRNKRIEYECYFKSFTGIFKKFTFSMKKSPFCFKFYPLSL